jgi:hypothetical protein
MDRPPIDRAEPAAEPESPPRRTVWPSWAASLLLHLGIFAVLAIVLRAAPRQGAVEERTADVGIALKQQEGDREYFISGDEASEAAAEAPTAGTTGPTLDELLSDQPPVDPTKALPAPTGVIGPAALEGGGVSSAAGATAGSGRGKGDFGGKARVEVFGVEGQGHKFVYVFDRSGSMGGSGRNALTAAKAELIGSLESLDRVHQFQVIFYNERPWVFNPSGKPGKLAFATEQNKRLAEKFVGSITADGATRHEDALLAALRMQPDVIFFLTDADEPKLSAAELYRIGRLAGGVTINTIEFGFGPQTDPNNFLVRLARQNGGRHAYVDISKLVPVRRP